MERDELVHYLAEVCAGLQVPMSMDWRVLGAAARPWAHIHAEVASRLGEGAHHPDDFERVLRELLGLPRRAPTDDEIDGWAV